MLRLTLPDGILARLRALFLVTGLLTLGAITLVLALGERLPWPSYLVGGLLVLLTGSSWVQIYRRGRVLPALDAANVLGLLALALAVGSVERVAGLAFVGLYFLLLYGSTRRAVLLVVGYATALAVAKLLLRGATPDALVAEQIVGGASGLVFTGTAFHLLARTMARFDAARHRERLLGEAGARLMTAAEPPEIYAAGLAAVPAMLGEDAVARAAIVRLDAERATATVAAAAGPGTGSWTGRTLRLDALPHAWRLALTAAPLTAEPAAAAALLAALGAEAQPTPLLGVPLIRASGPDELLLVFSAAAAPPEAHEALQVLGSQLALALESAARRADRFRALVQNASDSITILGPQREIRYQTPSIERILGYSPAEVLGRPLIELIHADDVPALHQELTDLLAEPGGVRAVTGRVRHQDGSWRLMEATVANLLHEPTVEGIVINARDVTERERLAQQLRQAQKLEAVGTLAGGVAHDFNNLLMVISGYVQLVQADGLESQQVPLAEIARAASRAAELTQQLLAYSRRQMLQPTVLDVNAVVRGSVPVLQPLLGPGIELELALAPALGAVRADAEQLRQVLVNLVTNARDAMPAGGRLTLRTRNRQLDAETPRGTPQAVPPGAYVELVVADTGRGMDAPTQARLFEPFFTTKEVGRGRGLGLATVYGIVRQSEGYVEAESEPGRGTTFTVLLPRVRAVEPAPDGARPATVLVVEPEAAVCSLVEAVLHHCGYQVLAAPNAREALALARRAPAGIDLVLAELETSGLNEAEIAAALPAARVVFTSAYAEEHSAVPGRAPVLPKPLSPAVLLQTVAAVLAEPPLAPLG